MPTTNKTSCKILMSICDRRFGGWLPYPGQSFTIERELFAKARHLFDNALVDALVARVLELLGDAAADDLHLRHPHAAAGHRRAAQADAEVTAGFCGSLGMVFLLVVMRTDSRSACASLPVVLKGRRSTDITWLSVPPETMASPCSMSTSARRRALATTRC